MIIPGFVDLQVNGYKGVDFSSKELTEKSFIYACQELISHGTVFFLPTIITNTPEVYQKNLGIISSCINDPEFFHHIPGIHVEGPFISPEDGARGAHNKEWVRKPDINFLDQLFQWSEGKIKLLTIAAELEGADKICEKATKLGINVSLGHQMAAGNDIRKLAESGARTLTHLGNGLPQMIDRHNNPLWEGISNDDLTAMIITDGHHLPPSLIKTIIRAKGTSKIIVVSDASPIAGLPPGNYNTLGNEVILEPSGFLFNPETGYLVGSSSTMLDCLNYIWSLNLVTFSQLLDIGFYNPLKLLNINPLEVQNNIKPKVKWQNEFVLISSDIF